MMMPVARLALLRAYPRSELLPVLNFVTMPGLVGPILGPGTRRGICYLGQLALDFPDKHSDRRNWHSVRP
ncbi:major facilitator superfamily permease [Klebsiella pneumoniae]|nr:major facilitator superfamily permease [Klebsiella pneumoniae]